MSSAGRPPRANATDAEEEYSEQDADHANRLGSVGFTGKEEKYTGDRSKDASKLNQFPGFWSLLD